MTSLLRVVLATFALLLTSAAANADMRVFASRHYQIHTDLEPGLAQDLARRMDVMYDEYARRLIQFDLDSARLSTDVYLFNGRTSYLRFVGESMQSTGGVFMASRNALVSFADGQGRDNLRRTLQHEAFHQFAANTIRYPLPMWVNEGIAQYFEEGLWTGEGFLVGQVPPRRVRQLQADIKAGRLIEMEKFLHTSADDWAKALGTRSATRGATQYNQAWAMVHFLLNANNEAMRPRFIHMLRLIHDGADPDLAFVQAFSGNYPGFRDRLLEWAAGLQPTAEATYIERQEVLADMMVALRGYGRTFDDMNSFRDATTRAGLEIQYSKGQIKWSSGRDASVYFLRVDGTEFPPGQLFLQARRTAPLPDIVCRCLPGSILRTRFYKAADRIEHELLIETANATTRTMASPLR